MTDTRLIVVSNALYGDCMVQVIVKNEDELQKFVKKYNLTEYQVFPYEDFCKSVGEFIEVTRDGVRTVNKT